jgi:hypothetical protein
VAASDVGTTTLTALEETFDRLAVDYQCRASEFLAQGLVGPDPRS